MDVLVLLVRPCIRPLAQEAHDGRSPERVACSS